MGSPHSAPALMPLRSIYAAALMPPFLVVVGFVHAASGHGGEHGGIRGHFDVYSQSILHLERGSVVGVSGSKGVNWPGRRGRTGLQTVECWRGC